VKLFDISELNTFSVNLCTTSRNTSVLILLYSNNEILNKQIGYTELFKVAIFVRWAKMRCKAEIRLHSYRKVHIIM
jgi:hypothetical protein